MQTFRGARFPGEARHQHADAALSLAFHQGGSSGARGPGRGLAPGPGTLPTFPAPQGGTGCRLLIPGVSHAPHESVLQALARQRGLPTRGLLLKTRLCVSMPSPSLSPAPCLCRPLMPSSGVRGRLAPQAQPDELSRHRAACVLTVPFPLGHSSQTLVPTWPSAVRGGWGHQKEGPGGNPSGTRLTSQVRALGKNPPPSCRQGPPAL